MGRHKGSKNKEVSMFCHSCEAEYKLKRVEKDRENLCKKCGNNKRLKLFRKKNPSWEKERRRGYQLKSKYGLSIDDYDEMLKKQNGKCSICGHDQSTENHSLCVDHDHVTGKVRGLLCHKCNQGIGLLKDDTIQATRYLMSHVELDWDRYFMNMAILVSSRSKDRSTKVGAVIVKDKIIVSSGYNGFPRGMNDDIDERHKRPTKYLYMSHAEENAIFNAARIGSGVADSSIYVTLHPCTTCSRAIIQSQIKNVFILKGNVPEHWADDLKISNSMLSEVGISVNYI